MNDVDVFNYACTESLATFTTQAFSLVEPSTTYQHSWHIDCIAEHLQAVYDGEIRNLIINMPPRALKTHTTSVAFPAWALGRDPSSRFILTSFKSSLAEAMTRKTRQILRSDWYRQCFPKTIISDDMNRQYHFETTELGQYYSSAMESVTGMGGDYVLCDDPLNPNEAASDVMRLHAIETIKGTLFSRFNDPRAGKFILNMQRLHDADPSGELLRETGFYHLKLPAEAIGKSYYYSVRGKKWELKQNELLFPARFTREVLDKALERLGSYNYAGQYLQEPVPIGGQDLRGEWIQHYAQGSIKPSTMNICILVDPSGGEDMNRKKGKLSDWTAMVVIGLAPDNNYYLLDVVRDRLNPTERIDTLFMLHRKWNTLSGKPPKVGYEKYGMMTDTHYIREKQKSDAYHFPILELGGQMKKEDRIRRLIPDMQNNRWYFPQSLIYVDMEGRSYDLVQEIIKAEMATFPRSRYDDMIDAISRIFDMDMVFPKPKLGIVGNAVKKARTPTSRGWKDF